MGYRRLACFETGQNQAQEHAVLGGNAHSREHLERHHGLEVRTASIRASERALEASQLVIDMPG